MVTIFENITFQTTKMFRVTKYGYSVTKYGYYPPFKPALRARFNFLLLSLLGFGGEISYFLYRKTAVSRRSAKRLLLRNLRAYIK